MTSYSLAETARILRVSPGRLRYWERTELVRRGAGELADEDAQAGFGFRDLVHLRGVMGLLEDGVPLGRIRRSLDALRERAPDLEEPLRDLHVHDPSGRIVVRHEGQLLEPTGQLVLDFWEEVEPAETPVAGLAEVRAREELDGEPDSALAWFERGSSLDADPATAEAALAAYRRAVELEPDFADAWCNMGTLHYNRSDRDAARTAYEKALSIDENHLEASFNLGNLFEEEGRRETALHHYKRAVRADPFFPEAHLNLALLYEKLGLARAALGHWRRYLQLVPEGSWADLARERLGKAPGGD